jgi:hypothetical protein
MISIGKAGWTDGIKKFIVHGLSPSHKKDDDVILELDEQEAGTGRGTPLSVMPRQALLE